MAKSVLEVAVGLLARREHSELELSRKLEQRGFDEHTISETIGNLKAQRLLSQERFTESYINMRRSRGYGPLRIAAELRERGVEDMLVARYLDDDQYDWRGDLRVQYRKKYPRDAQLDYAEKAKRVRFLQSRGYPLEWIFRLLDFEE